MKQQQRELIVTVTESGEPVDIDAFCERYTQVLIREVQEKEWLIQEDESVTR